LINLILVLLLFCCTNSIKNPIIKSDPTQAYADQLKDQINNFVFLSKEMKLDQNCVETKWESCDAIPMGSASGLILSADSKSIIVLTAAHFCVNDTMPYGYPQITPTVLGVANDSPRELNILAMDVDNDLCLLSGIKYKEENFDPIKLAPNLPKIGEKVYSVSAPNAISGPGIRLVFDGAYGGCTNTYCMFTVPATFGSSGGGIYDKDGHLLSIVMAVTVGFENVVISPTHESLVNFISTIDESINIY